MRILLLGTDSVREQQVRIILAEAARQVEPTEIDVAADLSLAGGSNVAQPWAQHVADYDLVAFDVTYPSPQLLFELGLVTAQGTSTVLLAESSLFLSSDLAHFRVLIYGETERQVRMFAASTWANLLRELRSSTGTTSHGPAWPSPSGREIFISYSHADDYFLRRLLVHLAPIEREGLVEAWADTKLVPGDDWRAEIEASVAACRIAVLLISADFLASEFIVTNELPPLLDRASSRGARIIPVIIGFSRFARMPELSKFQAVNDPKTPLGVLAQHEQDQIFDRVAAQVESVVSSSI